MMKFLLTGAFGSVNRGDAARVKTAVSALHKELPQATFDFMTTDPATDQGIYKDSSLKVIGTYKYANQVSNRLLSSIVRVAELIVLLVDVLIWRVSNGVITIFRSRHLASYDMVIDLSGESLTDYYGQISLLRCLYPMLISIILKKKVVIYAQSIGPFENTITKSLARMILNHTSLIIVRDSYSYSFLEKYNITRPPIHCTTDPAFVLCPASKEKIHEILKKENMEERQGKCRIGIAASRGSFRRSVSGEIDIDETYQKFIAVMSAVVDQLTSQLDAEIVFIPHVISLRQDDRKVAKEIYDKSNKNNRIHLLDGEYTAEELKGIIAECDMFIGSRMHANIASLSSLVPTVAIAYSHKMFSLMESLQLGDYVCDIETLTVDELLSKTIGAWGSREMLTSHLTKQIDQIKRINRLSAKLVADVYYNVDNVDKIKSVAQSNF